MQTSKSLAIYEAAGPVSRTGDAFFTAILAGSIVLFAVLGLFLRSVKLMPVIFDEKKIEKIKTHFLFEEKKKPAVRKEQSARALPAPKPEKKKPIDLTQGAKLAQKDDEIVEQKPEEEKKEEVERVYGLRKVYSVGLGAGGDASEAVIGKLGNTIEKDVDTITATREQLRGRVASVTTVSKMPVLKVRIKPLYTDAMRKNGVTGVVRVKILIGEDGKVKEIKVLNDLGFGSREAAIEAARKLVFEPALAGTKPVSVWIELKFKFVLTE